MMEKFQTWKIALISYTESFDTSTSMGRAMIGIVGVFAQLERELTSERVKANMEERAIQGKHTCNEIMRYDIIRRVRILYRLMTQKLYMCGSVLTNT